jgi:ATP-dependent Clp protease ATP-binding subunit ClpC
MFEKFNEHARRSLFFARYEASRTRSRAIGTEHLLLGILREADDAVVELLDRLDVDLNELREELIGELAQVSRVSTSPDLPLAEETKRALAHAVYESDQLGQEHVGTEHLVLGILRMEDTLAAQYLEEHGLDLMEVRNEVSRLGREKELEASARATPNLTEYSRDLTYLASQGVFDPLIGREQEVDRMIQILSRRTKNNPLLLGEAGVGKTAIVEGLATRIVEGRVPLQLADRRILALDLSLLVAGTKYRGQFEERLKGLLKELQEHTEIIIFIDEIHSLIGTGSAEGSLDAANILKPALSRGEITCIGATTMKEYRKYIEKDRALSRRFQPVAIRQPTEEETIDILLGVRDRYEEFHGIRYEDDAVLAAVRLSGRYITDRFFPDKAIDVIDEAGARVKLRSAESTTALRKIQGEMQTVVRQMKDAISRKDFERAVELREEELRLREETAMLERTVAGGGETATVRREDVEEVVASWTGIPITSIKEDEAERLERMEEILRQRVVGQDEAISALSRAIRRSRLGVTSPHRPIGSFIFLGPSGVGKTEVARQLARFLFQDPRRLVRFDMSEYMEKHTVSRLIGSPPGYVGFEEGGQLSEQVRRNPYSVVLLDEIEKAHPDIYNLLLQVLEDGRLTDNYGNVVDFTNTIIIMTSNLGSRHMVPTGRVGFGKAGQAAATSAEIEELVDRQLRKHFPPEFLNRLDDVVVFRPLSEESLHLVARLLLEETAENLGRHDVELEWNPELPAWLVARAGIDPAAGARPLRRLVQRWVEDALADHLIARRGRRGGERLVVEIEDGEVTVKDLEPVEQAKEAQ